MKRILSLVLAMMLVLAFASCGSTGTDAPDTTAPADTTAAPASETTAPEPEVTDGLPDTNMDGFSLNILHHNDTWLTWAKTQLVAAETNGELINDAIHAREIAIEDRFNCVLNISETDKVSDVFQNLVNSGDTSYDLIMQYGLQVLNNINFLANFNNLPYIQLDREYWNPNATSVFAVGDKQLAIAGNYTLSYLSGATTFLFNKDVADSLNLTESIYQSVYDGKWTTDKFYETVVQGIADLDGNSTIDPVNDRIGITGSAKAYWNSLIIGAGFRYVDFNENHEPVGNLQGNEPMLSFLQKIVERESTDPNIYPVTNDMLNFSPMKNAEPNADFKSGHAFFSQATTFAIETEMRDMETDFGILPPPKYDENQATYKSYANIGEILTLPRTFDMSRAENVGMLLEAMAFYSQQHIVPSYRETVLQVKLTRDNDSPKMLDYIFSDIVFDYGTVVWETPITGTLIEKYLMPRSSTLVSTVENISKRINVDIKMLLKSAANVQ